ncbi:MAG: DEAD/DEAH box helicase [Candidatus Aenigmatarchaeota archaeon]
MEDFRDFNLSNQILKSIQDKDFDSPTQIQEKAIPPIMEGKDVIAGSATGSGKTLAFAAGLVENVDPKEDVIQGLVLAPTRELAKQVSDMVDDFSRHHEYDIATIHGGVAYDPQYRALSKAEIVVATPGRLLDLIGKGRVDLSNVNTFVLDEADRMLDMGFIDDVEEIMQETPEEKQTIFTSATIKGEILKLADRYMDDPVKTFAERKVDPEKLEQVYYDIPGHLKLSLLVHLLDEEETDLSMVFCNTRRTVEFVERNLKKQGIKAQAIHGGFSQNQRDKAMEKFEEGGIDVLVCTDVAARGLDIDNISHIYNFDIPNDSKQYMHRIGRTARAGEEGKAINLLEKDQHKDFRRVLKDNSVNVNKAETPYVEKVNVE